MVVSLESRKYDDLLFMKNSKVSTAPLFFPSAITKSENKSIKYRIPPGNYLHSYGGWEENVHTFYNKKVPRIVLMF